MKEEKKINDEKKLEDVSGGRVPPKFEAPVWDPDVTTYTCPNCGGKMYDNNLAGGTLVTCNNCGKLFDVRGGVITEVK